ncbi:MAG: RluA family pseudouridine synthase [Parcubacteria group bacterium]
MKYTVDPKYKNWRLDKFLTEKTGETRNQIQKQIKAGLILVNGEKSKVHRFLNVGETIEIQSTKSEISAAQSCRQAALRCQNKFKTQNLNSKDTTIYSLPPTSLLDKIANFFAPKLKPKIIAKTKDYLVIEKPAGMLVHSTFKNETNTVVDWLIKKFPKTKKLEDVSRVSTGKGMNTPYRPGIIHRIDRDVSGLLLIPFNLNAFDNFKEQFKKRKIKKEYIALVRGQMPEDTGEIEFEISRSAEGKRMAAHPKNSGKGKPSVTKYTVLKRFAKFTLMKVEPQTGRTNQIRVHFLAIGHPIVGDTVYKLKTQSPKSKKNSKYKNKNQIDISRPFLHSNKLTFADLQGKIQTYESKLPTELEEILKQI